MLTDILSFILAKGFQQHAKDASIAVPQRLVSEREMGHDVLRNCFKLLHALAYRNEMVICGIE